MKLIEHFVNGKIIPGSSNRIGRVFNPATGEQDSEVRLASKIDLDATKNSGGFEASPSSASQFDTSWMLNYKKNDASKNEREKVFDKSRSYKF